MNFIEALPAPFPYRLWLVALKDMPSVSDIELLSPDERARAARYVFERDRRRFLCAHIALRKTLAMYVGTTPESLSFETGPFGKPSLTQETPCVFNMSHSQDVAIVAVAREGEIGVDVEVVRDVPDAIKLAEMNFTVSEREQLRTLSGAAFDTSFLRCWTRKEACLKAIGSGLSIAPHLFTAGIFASTNHVFIPTERGPVNLIVESLPERGEMLVALARIVAGKAR